MTIHERQHSHPMRRAIGAALLAACLAAAEPALAQDAPGDTRALDANLNTTSRYNQPRQGFLLNRINEAIVTGTAPGGKSFRGDVGYTSPFAFRGATAGGRIYDFERDSYYSNIAPRRGAPRHPGVLGAYQIPGLSPDGDSPYSAGASLRTPMSGANLQQIARARYGSSLPDLDVNTTAQQLRPQRGTAGPSTGPATGSALERNLDPAARAVINSVDPFLDRSALQAASAGGALAPRFTPSGPDADSSALPPDNPVTRDALSRGIDRTFDGVAFSEGWSNRIASTSSAAPSAAAPLLVGQDSYADYIARLTSKPAAGPLPQPGQPYGDDTMDSMRQFSQDVMGIDAQNDLPQIAPASPLESLTEDHLLQLSRPVPAISSLAGDNTSQFADHVRLGETAVAEGRYFDAESWFDVALYYTPDHPLAVAGRVHAQIGSGKYRSAALGLRRLFESHPELINSLYADNLLPERARLDAAAAELREMLTRAGATIEAGLLLAYIGHLTQQPQLISQGLDDRAAKQPDDALGGVLRRVWLAAPAP